MVRFVSEDVKNCLHTTTYKFLFGIYMLLCMSGFFLTVKKEYGEYRQLIRPFGQYFILESTSCGGFVGYSIILIPFIAIFVYALQTIYERKKGISYTILLRTTKRRYIWGRGIAIFIVNFMTIFIPLVVNYLLCMIAFPKEGLDNKFGVAPYDIFNQYKPDKLFDMLRIQHPILYDWILILMLSLTVAGLAILSYGITCIVNYSKHHYMLIGLYITLGIYALAAVGTMFKLPFLNYLNFVQESQQVQVGGLLLFWLILYGVGLSLIGIGRKLYEEL